MIKISALQGLKPGPAFPVSLVGALLAILPFLLLATGTLWAAEPPGESPVLADSPEPGKAGGESQDLDDPQVLDDKEFPRILIRPGQPGEPLERIVVGEPSQASPHETAVAQVPDPEATAPAYDVPIHINPAVTRRIHYFTDTIRDRFEEWLQRSVRYVPLMRSILREKGLPEDLVYMALIESGFNPYAYSRSRASGPWQFIRGTGRKYGLMINWWVDERRDPVKSTEAAAEYLKDLYEMFGTWPLAMASYNAGEGRVRRAVLRSRADDFWALRRTRHLRRETKEYVPKFMAATIIAKNPEEHGFTLEPAETFHSDEVVIPRPTDLRVLAKAAETTLDEIRSLNPELRRWSTPPWSYTLRIPTGQKKRFLENLAQIPEKQRITWRYYKVRRGDSVFRIARRFGITTRALAAINGISTRKRLKLGQTLRLPPADAWALSLSRDGRYRGRKALKPGQRVIHRVRRGDTLWDISQTYKVSLATLIRINGITNARYLRPGRRLVISRER